MALNYVEDGDEISIEGEECPNCESEATHFDRAFKFWKCEDCSMVWTQTKRIETWNMKVEELNHE